MPEEVKWFIGGEKEADPGGKVKGGSGLPLLAYRPAFDITEKLPKGQATTAQWFNEMRERLLLTGEMRPE